MSEREYHDHHYEAEASRILGSRVFTWVHDRAVREFLSSTGMGRRHRILSLGCGDGAIEVRLARHVGEVLGVDVSSVAVGKARARAAQAGLRNASFIVSEPGDAPPGDLGRFDAVVAFAFLHHLADHEILHALKVARDALGSGGIFYSSDPNRRRLVGWFKSLVKATYARYHSPDERELEPEALASSAAQAGFSGCQIAYVDFFLGPLAWLAPRTPAWLVPGLGALDQLALSVPFIRRFASSFRLLARVN